MGEFELESEYAKTDAEGNQFEAELERIGYRGETPAEPTTGTVGQKFSHATLPESTSIHGISALAASRSSRTSVRQYDYHSSLELHIEQGPKLENNEKDVGVVTGVVGLTWGAGSSRRATNAFYKKR